MSVDPPLTLTAELTHRCPLHCPYCSNPVELTADELTTDAWVDAIDQASRLGVLQLHLTGGEPLLRGDLETLVDHAARRHLYTQLVTSGVGLDDRRATRLAELGLNSVQLSFQAADPTLADRIAGRKAHAVKLAAAAAIREAGLPLIANVVLHRLNVDRLEAIVELCVGLDPQRIELANVQFHGWAFPNRLALLPDAEQLARAEATYERLRLRLGDSVELAWILSDYAERRPKPCMGGWGRYAMTIAPDGAVLPCPAARSIATLTFDSIRERPLAWIWRESAAFNAYRGEAWMLEPCRSCDRRTVDHAGCRCQAFALTGDARRADPVCSLSPDHAPLVRSLADRGGGLRYRRFRYSSSSRPSGAISSP